MSTKKLIKPKKPSQPQKPEPSRERILKKTVIRSIDDDCIISNDELKSYAENGYSISIDYSDYSDYDYDSFSVEIFHEYEIVNPAYDREHERYLKKLAKYERDMKKYTSKMDEYKLKLKEYDKQQRAKKEKAKEREIQAELQMLKKLQEKYGVVTSLDS